MDAYLRPQFFRRALRRRWLTVLVAVLLGLVAGLATVVTSTSEYRATSVVFLDALVGNPYSPTTPSTRQEQLAALTTEAGLVLTDAVVQAAEESARDAGVDLGSRIEQRTSTEVPSNSQVVYISFTGQSPESAQVGAQALAAAYLEYRQARSEAVTTQQIARADEEIESVTSLLQAASEALDEAASPSEETTEVSAEVLNLQEQVRIYANQLGQLRIERSAAESVSKSPGEIVSPARAPTAPEGIPAPLLAAGVILVFLGGGVLLAFVREHLDTRLWTVDDVDAVGVGPVYGPAVAWRPELHGTGAEDTYRLAMSALHLDVTGRRVVAVLGTEGTVPQAVAAGLTQTIAEAGHAVTVLVAASDDADGDGRQGLSDVLHEGEVSGLAGALRVVRPGVRVMGTGRRADDMPKLVQRPVFTEVVEALSRKSDTLVVVGPDARTATGVAIARAAGTAVLVASAGRTSKEALLEAARLLEESGARLAGVLLTERSRRVRGRRDRRRPRRQVAELLSVAPPPDDEEPGAEPAPQVAARNGHTSRERLRSGGGGS